MYQYNFVYLTTCLINGKKYIGSHQTNNLNDGYLGGGRIIRNAVKVHGKNNFTREIIKHFDGIIDARKAEEYYIKMYDTIRPSGYNISPSGGMSGEYFGYHSEETKDLISKILREGKKLAGDKNPQYGKKGELSASWGIKHSEESNKKKSDSKIGDKNPQYGKKGELSPNYNKDVSEKTRKLQSINNKGENNNCFGRKGKLHPMFGKTHTEESRKKIQDKMALLIITCEHCGAKHRKRIYNRDHGNKCKYKK